MLSKTLAELYEKDLPRVKAEIEAYSSEETIWEVGEGTKNSGGNLALHIAGNLSHFFGAVIGGSDYKRDREFEFGGKVSREELIKRLDAAYESVMNTLNGMTDEELRKDYPLELLGYPMSTEFFFIHLLAHMTYHLGQINYHRRMIEE